MSSTYVPKSIRASATRSVWLKSPSAALRTSSAILVAILDEALETRVDSFQRILVRHRYFHQFIRGPHCER